jgi:PAS domain S-box-containing protein
MVNQILDSSVPMFIWWGSSMIQFYNDAYLEILGADENSKHPKALGQKGEECWPEIWPVISPLLDGVLKTASPVYLEDQLIPIYRHGRLDDVYWTFSYNLIRNCDGSAGGILVVCSETTDKIRFQQENAAINEELSATNNELSQSQHNLQELNHQLEHRVELRTRELQKAQRRLATVVGEVPAGLAILSGKNMVLEMANSYMLGLWDKNEQAIGKALLDFLPELRDQPFPVILEEVYTTGKTYIATETPVALNRGGKDDIVYMDFSYTPLKDVSGNPNGILVLAEDVSERTLSRQREQQLTEKLTASNEELRDTVKELADIQHKMEAIIRQLKESEGRFQQLIKDAPTGIIVLRGEDMMVEIVNDGYARLIGRKAEEVLHRPLFEVIPEAEAEFRSLIQNIWLTGQPCYLYDHPYIVYAGEKEIQGYLNLVYQPYREPDGSITGVMVLCQDVTEEVASRLKAQQAEERARLAMAAAGLGTFDLNIETGELVTSKRLDEILGVTPPASPEYYFSAFHPEDRTLREQADLESLKTGKLHYVARIVKEGEIRWGQVEGQVFFDKNHQPIRLVGSLQDITEQKLAQQQKDDFISIASHELKTPITSLKASLQLIDRIKDKPAGEAMPKLIQQARKSIQRVSTLVDDLLNVTRFQQGQMALHKTTFVISQLLNAITNPISITGKHQIRIVGDMALSIYADENRIDQVVTNLINNAVKYAPESKEILLSIENIGLHAKVSVKDQGPGIPEEKTAHLFDRFYRVDAAGYQASGFGLGLYISSEIIKRHGGDIGVNSELGKGSTFWFTLPLKITGDEGATGRL